MHPTHLSPRRNGFGSKFLFHCCMANHGQLWWQLHNLLAQSFKRRTHRRGLLQVLRVPSIFVSFETSSPSQASCGR
jgi:hypothetical protein